MILLDNLPEKFLFHSGKVQVHLVCDLELLLLSILEVKYKVRVRGQVPLHEDTQCHPLPRHSLLCR
jgi:hypothetical protein